MTGEIAGVDAARSRPALSCRLDDSGGRRLDFTLFAGPSVFTTDQMFVTSLMLSLDKEVFPFDTLAFPGAVTETLRENVIGYNAGVDMTWRFSTNSASGCCCAMRGGKKDFHANRRRAGRSRSRRIARRRGLRLIF